MEHILETSKETIKNLNKIALFSVPRSGSTWLGQIFNSSPEVTYRFQPNFAYSFPFTLSAKSSLEEINVFYRELLNTNDPFVRAEISISSKKNILFEKSKISTLFFKETHSLDIIENLINNSDTKIIGLIRSPFAVINSWLKTPKEFDPKWKIETEWENAQSKNQTKQSNYFGYNKWKEATKLFIKLNQDYPNQFYLISYNELLQNTEVEIKNIFEFCRLPFLDQTKSFIKESTSNTAKDDDAYSVFKSKKKDDAWEESLPEFIKEEILNDSEVKEWNKQFNWF